MRYTIETATGERLGAPQDSFFVARCVAEMYAMERRESVFVVGGDSLRTEIRNPYRPLAAI